jgi:O-antigen/teichoic acid export membrane protein
LTRRLIVDMQTLPSPAFRQLDPDSPVDTVARRTLDSAALIGGTVVSGLAVYGVSIIGIRAYGAADFAPISVLWTLWAVLAAVLTFPIQHWIIHRVAADGSEDAIASALSRIVMAGLALAIVLGAVSWLVGSRLFGERRVLWPLLVALLTVGATLTGVARGVLAGRRRFKSVAAIIAAENAVRLVACAAVVITDGSIAAFGCAFVSGAACLVAWPRAFRFAPRTSFELPPFAAFIGGLGAGNILAQVVLIAGPLVLSAMGADRGDVTALFVTMALFRAPYVVALGLSVQLTAPLTQLAASDRRDALRPLVRRTVAATVATAGLAALVTFAVGPQLVDFVYGRTAAPDAGVVALVAAGSVLALGTLALTVVLAARARTNRVATAWALAVLTSALVIAFAPLDPIAAVAVGFLTAEVVALIAMVAAPL